MRRGKGKKEGNVAPSQASISMGGEKRRMSLRGRKKRTSCHGGGKKKKLNAGPLQPVVGEGKRPRKRGREENTNKHRYHSRAQGRKKKAMRIFQIRGSPGERVGTEGKKRGVIGIKVVAKKEGKKKKRVTEDRASACGVNNPPKRRGEKERKVPRKKGEEEKKEKSSLCSMEREKTTSLRGKKGRGGVKKKVFNNIALTHFEKGEKGREKKEREGLS